jgi:hypothetical protein
MPVDHKREVGELNSNFKLIPRIISINSKWSQSKYIYIYIRVKVRSRHGGCSRFSMPYIFLVLGWSQGWGVMGIGGKGVMAVCYVLGFSGVT